MEETLTTLSTKLIATISQESVFVTLDVKSLYTSILNPEGIAAVKKTHEHYQHKTVPTKVITTF